MPAILVTVCEAWRLDGDDRNAATDINRAVTVLVFLDSSHPSTFKPSRLHLTRTWVRPSAMSDSEVSSTGGESTPASSSVPSPELFKLTLAELTEENKESAAKIKAEANAAFVGKFHLVTPPPSPVISTSGRKCRR